LAPGWHQISIESEDGLVSLARVLIVDPAVRTGLISDIDDTIISTHLPRPLVAAWNHLVLTESARLPVPGMARLYHDILRANPKAPVFYVSTGCWNTLPFLERFMIRHGYPIGPMLLTDWGPTNTGWFRSGPEHKYLALQGLRRDFPAIRWYLIGDDGQFDPLIYADFAHREPERVAGLVIRQLNPVQQVLAHGSWRQRPLTPKPLDGTRVVQGPDGDALRRLWPTLVTPNSD
jgi:phosphatidate phosphatase APP1